MDRYEGYVSDVDYNYGYYRILSPDHLSLACLNAGVAPPTYDRLHYLELAFGKGLTVNIHAAANPGTFWGTDINPNHALEARTLAAASGSDARLLGDSFAELAARPDLPQFDIMAIHGAWSWVSAENRRLVLDLIRRHLRPGGLFYVSYNCHPGWSSLDPVNHLLALHARYGDATGAGTLNKLEHALAFAQEMATSDALYFARNPGAVRQVHGLVGRGRNVLAHEVLSRGRTLMTFSGVTRELADAGLSFVASARLVDQFDEVNLSERGRKLLAGIDSPILRQSVRDYLVNQQTRCDIFVSGLRRLTATERTEALQDTRFVLTVDPTHLPREIAGARGKVTLDERVFLPLLKVLAENRHEPRTLRQVGRHERLQSVPQPRLLETLMLLVAAGHVATAREPSAETQARCKALNRYLWNRARSDGEVSWLASPVVGAGVVASRFEQLFLAAVAMGKTSPTEQAAIAWRILSSQGHRLTRDGKTLETAQEHIDHLTRMANLFTDQRLRILRTLELV